MSGLRQCECGGRAKVHAVQVAEDAMETWVACTRCDRRTEEIEDAYADHATAEWQWNRGALKTRALNLNETRHAE